MKRLVSVEISGNLLSEFLLINLSDENTKHNFAKPESFRWYKHDFIQTQTLHTFHIANAYEEIIARWDNLHPKIAAFSQSELREKWLKFFFFQLGYDLQYQKADVIAGELKFPLSHRAWDGKDAPVVHTLPYWQNLDAKVNDGRHKYSPHDTLQRYLIQAEHDIWGIVTNGREIRLLRSFHHETRKAFIKFDLETMLDGRNFQDFRLLYRLLHPSRFLPPKDKTEPILELLFEESKAAGVAIGENLRVNIKLAIEELANGFLGATDTLTRELTDNQEKTNEFHHQLLQVIYRILFLLYAEQRNLMPQSSSLYFQEYSISALRKLIEEGYYEDGDFTDLWEGLKVTFQMVYKGVPELGIPNYNGLLFASEQISLLERCACQNEYVLKMIRYLTYMEKGGIKQRISYIELGVDEIGSVYESLLDFAPRISSLSQSFEDEMVVNGKHKKAIRTIPPYTFFLDPRGTNRKTSGSYYTHPGLVNALIESALAPVLAERLKQSDEPEKALLSLKICDPACGSGAFLIAATEFLGQRLAQIRAQDDYPADSILRHARRDVLRHCIYGVDLNPMAVELCKVSLWLTAATDVQPLNFLDHHIRCGNSLVGTTPELLQANIPVEAFSPISGDDTELSRERKAEAQKFIKNTSVRQQEYRFDFEAHRDDVIILKGIDYSALFPENTAAETALLKEEYENSRKKEDFLRQKMIADYWTAAFFWQHIKQEKEISPLLAYPNPETLESLFQNPHYDLPQEMKQKIEEIAQEYRFFHWYLEFPDVFENGGFDCLLGNPPWDNVQPEEKQFFATYNPEIADQSGSKRKKAIDALLESDLQLYEDWIKYKRNIYLFSKFVRFSNRYPLTAIGKLNLYPVFAETFRSLLNAKGRAGFITPTGIATDDSTKYFFGDLIEHKSLVSLFDFENKEALFSSVHRSFKFCLLTLSGKAQESVLFSFFSTNPAQLYDTLRTFSLSPDDIAKINPNTKTTPVFRTRTDAELTKAIYRRVPVLINEETLENPWGISFKQGLFNMTSDSHLFHTEATEESVTLYEAKMIWHYDHRFGTYEGYDNNTSSSHLPNLTPEQYNDPHFTITPRYWVEKSEVLKRLAYPKDKKTQEWFETISLEKQREYLEEKAPKWLMGFRDVTNSTNERTSIFSYLPKNGVNHKMPLVFSGNIAANFVIISNFNSLVLDFIVRQKIGGTSLSYYIVKQLPVLPPDYYTEEDIAFIKPRVLELVYTAYDLRSFAEDMGYVGEPFGWDEERRAHLKAELDAYYAKLYGLNRKQLRYILDPADLTPAELQDILSPWEEVENPLVESEYQKRCRQSIFPGETFRVLKEKEKRQFGEYRTRRLVLEKWEEMVEKKRVDEKC
jgi:hypothetical protein